MTLVEQLQEFIKDSSTWNNNRKWIEDDHMKVYVRRGQRHLPARDFSPKPQRVTTLEDEQGQGLFKAFLAEAIKHNPWDALYVENVLSSRFESFFVRSGFLPVPDSLPPSFYIWNDV